MRALTTLPRRWLPAAERRVVSLSNSGNSGRQLRGTRPHAVVHRYFRGWFPWHGRNLGCLNKGAFKRSHRNQPGRRNQNRPETGQQQGGGAKQGRPRIGRAAGATVKV